jgi:DNA-binding IclR family transcriptional regulator
MADISKLPQTAEKTRHRSGDRMLAVLRLFTIERPVWSIEQAAERLGISIATSYRYFKGLTKEGFISPISRGNFTLGPAIIELDRQIQICDPMLRAARGPMEDLIQYAAEGSVILLCRLFHDRVMCVHQVMGRGPQKQVNYERGRLMPLFLAATAKIILAHLPPRTLKTLFAHHASEIAAARLGNSWDEFRSKLAALRRAGVATTRGDIDPARVGIAAPIFNKEGAILGSLAFVLSTDRADETLIGRLVPLTMAGAREIERAMGKEGASIEASPASAGKAG